MDASEEGLPEFDEQPEMMQCPECGGEAWNLNGEIDCEICGWIVE